MSSQAFSIEKLCMRVCVCAAHISTPNCVYLPKTEMDAGTSNLYPILSSTFLALLFPVLVTPSDSENPASILLSIVAYF